MYIRLVFNCIKYFNKHSVLTIHLILKIFIFPSCVRFPKDLKCWMVFWLVLSVCCLLNSIASSLNCFFEIWKNKLTTSCLIISFFYALLLFLIGWIKEKSNINHKVIIFTFYFCKKSTCKTMCIIFKQWPKKSLNSLKTMTNQIIWLIILGLWW